jgi:hypothetical protein
VGLEPMTFAKNSFALRKERRTTENGKEKKE